jgi:hypothetical protein
LFANELDGFNLAMVAFLRFFPRFELGAILAAAILA